MARQKDTQIQNESAYLLFTQIVKVNPRFASAQIICVGTKALKEPFRGIIRYNNNLLTLHETT